MVQVVGYLAEKIIELTPNEASTLALAAAQAAHAMDDFRYNGLWNAQTADQLAELDGEPSGRVAKWHAAKPERDAQQKRWCDLATLLNPETYPEGWNTHG